MQGCKTKHQKFSMLWALALAIVALVASPQAALAQGDCNPGLIMSTTASTGSFIGDEVTHRHIMRANESTGATTLTIASLQHHLDCTNTGGGSIVPCNDENVINRKSLVGTADVGTSCVDAGAVAVTWACGTAGNIVTCTSNNPVVIPIGSECFVDVKFQIDHVSGTNGDLTPGVIEEQANYVGSCDNGLDNAAFSSIAVAVNVCEVTVDKQVSCDGGLTYVDVADGDTLEESCIGWEGFDGMPAEAVLGKWVIQNTGTVPLYNCELSDTNSLLLENGLIALLNDPLGVGGTETVEDSGLCTDAFDALEPNTASVNCACADVALIDADPVATASDTADVNCQEPGLTLTKVCDPQDVTNDVTVTATNIGEAGLINCEFEDRVSTGDPACPAVDPESGDLVALNGLVQPFDLAVTEPPSSATATGTVAGLVANACNTAWVTCEIDSGDGTPVLDPISGLAKTISRLDDDVCEVDGDDCLTRTPGFWGNHPHITSLFLPAEICGVDINNVGTSQGSAIQNMCSVGKDPKTNEVSNQQIQLERQCTAAVLNVIATAEEFDASCDSAYPGIAGTIADCCGFGQEEGDPAAVCDAGLLPGELGVNDKTINSCIGLLDAFNNNDTNEPDDLTGTPFESPGPADSSVCRDSKNDGFINDGTDRATVCKGKGCN